MAFALVGGAAWVAASGACTLITPADSFQCKTDGDCAARGAAFAGTTCSDGLCVATSSNRWELVDDRCPFPNDQLLTSRESRLHSGEIALNDLVDDIQVCGKLTGFDGPDGVVGVELAAGERVYVEADFVKEPGETAPPIDLGVYVMGTCDPANCLARVERCKPGLGESIARQATEAGTYYFGFDSKAYDELTYSPNVQLSFTFPTCGNNEEEKGETCDDGNLVAGDGCSPSCLAELRMRGGVPPVEQEPNNHRDVANLIKLDSAASFTLKGFIGGGCDLDFYLFKVPEGAFPRVTMLGQDGRDCPEGTPAFTLEFDDISGDAELGAAKIPATEGGTNYCPQFDENSFVTRSLPAGTYMLELKPFDKGDHPQFGYLLRIEVVDPATALGGTGGTTSGTGNGAGVGNGG